MAQKSISEFRIDRLTDLCRMVETTFSQTVSTPKHFEALAESIFNNTGTYISPTTLKRLWGYINEPMVPRTATLDILARYCGWKDFSHYISGKDTEIESGAIGTLVLNTERDVRKGDRIKLMWNPGRICIILYKGNYIWEVVESKLTRLSKGDTFSCALFVNGEPLYLDNLVKEGRKTGVYVCGRKSGITFQRID